MKNNIVLKLTVFCLLGGILSGQPAHLKNTPYDLSNNIAFGYCSADSSTGLPEGPVWFNLMTPGIIHSIDDQSSLSPSFAATWAVNSWYNTTLNSNLIIIDTATGARTAIGPLGTAIYGLTYDPVAETMYGIDYDAGAPGQSALYSIDMANGTAIQIGGSTGGELLGGLASPSWGGLYSVNVMTNEFGSVDPGNGNFTPIGPIGFDASSFTLDMEFDRDNDACYICAYNNGEGQLRLVDINTGNTTLIGSFQGGVNISGFAIPYSSQSLTINLAACLEGPYNTNFNGMNVSLYNNGSLPLNQPFNVSPWNYYGPESVSAMPNSEIVDWVLVELRDAPADDPSAATSGTVLDQRAGFILQDGSIVELDGSSPLNFSGEVSGHLFAVICHRNHIPVISNFSVSQTGGVYYYDFTSGVNQVYGGANAHKEVDAGVWALAAGDGSADGQVESADKNVIWSTQAGSSGYLSGDFNMDGQVESADKNVIWYFNAGFGTQVPDNFIPQVGCRSYVPD